MHPLLTLVWFLRSLVVILLWELISSGSFQEAVTAFRLPLCLPYFSQCLALTGHSQKKSVKLTRTRQSACVCTFSFLLAIICACCSLLFRFVGLLKTYHTLSTQGMFSSASGLQHVTSPLSHEISRAGSSFYR